MSSTRLAFSRKIEVLFVLIVILAITIPTGAWYLSTFPQNPTEATQTVAFSPTPILTLSPTRTFAQIQPANSPPAQLPSPTSVQITNIETTTAPIGSPSISQAPTPQPSLTVIPTSTPSPPTSPNPLASHPPKGNGPSVANLTNEEGPSTVQYFLNGASYLEKSFFAVSNANSTMGNWSGSVSYAPLNWLPSARVRLGISVAVSKEVLTEYLSYWNRIDNACVLVTAERDYDAQGRQHTPWDNTFSTILTPSELPIEGGGSAALSWRNGYNMTGPVDLMLETPFSSFTVSNDTGWATGTIYGSFDLPNNLPPGIYRLRLDFGLKTSYRYIDFNNNTIGARPQDLNSLSCLYSQPIPSSGWSTDGTWIDGTQIERKPYWDLLWDYNSNGYRGVVAQEDQSLVAISPRNMIHDVIVLPKVDINGNPVSYNIEPNFLLDNDNTQRNIPMNYRSGQWTVKVTLPNGTRVNLGTTNFMVRRGNGASTQNVTFTSWRPPVYGNYSLEAYGWIQDIWGNTYYGGGNYTFWIANRLTMATATFQGMPYNVGNRYGRDVAFNPPVPANVTMKAQLFVNSDPNNVTMVISNGTATVGGVWGVAQGMIPLTFTAPGEYFATVTATFVDPTGALWVSVMTHAGVVYPTNSSIVAHGKKLSLPNGTIAEYGQTHTEGYIAANGTQYLQHINFPYNFSDVLEIASEFQGANKIEPVLTYAQNGTNAPYDPNWQPIGRTNIHIRTSNGLSAEMFPEYITDRQYYYGAGAEPGFNARFMVADDNTRAPYWPTSNNNFGGEFGASNNGDMPGTIYRLLGGVVLRNSGQSPAYAGYQADAFILPKGTNNNRVIAPGDEDLPSPDNVNSRFFMVPVRPGSTYPVGATFTPVLQIDPITPCNVTFTVIAPDNTSFVSTGQGDQYGYFTGKGVTLSQTGVWTYKVNATWNGYQGHVPGLPDAGGWIYVIENATPPGSGLTLKMPTQQTFSATAGLNITGQTTATKVFFAAIIPGAVLQEGTIPVTNGTFTYNFSPQKMASLIQTYDIVNMVNGQPQIGKIVHLTFFTTETATDGTTYHSFVRVVLRGTTAIYVKER